MKLRHIRHYPPLLALMAAVWLAEEQHVWVFSRLQRLRSFVTVVGRLLDNASPFPTRVESCRTASGVSPQRRELQITYLHVFDRRIHRLSQTSLYCGCLFQNIIIPSQNVLLMDGPSGVWQAVQWFVALEHLSRTQLVTR